MAKSTNRKGIPQSVRFEVFKRDKFKCQYCGRYAPDVILEVDHILPVSKGGKNEIINLLTSCFDCNIGKSDKLLSDETSILKQRDQLEQLQIRREQIEMMLQWKMGLSKIDEDQYQKVIDYCNSKSVHFHLSETGEKNLRGIIKKYGTIKVVDAIDESFEKHYWGTNHVENYEFVIKKIKSILYFNSLSPEKRVEKERVAETIKRVKNKFYYYFDYQEAVKAISHFLSSGGTAEDIDAITDDCTKFSEWKSSMY